MESFNQDIPEKNEKEPVVEEPTDWQMSVEEFANNGCLINFN